jgi:hypothetical protein
MLMIQLTFKASNHEAKYCTLDLLTMRYKLFFVLSEAALYDQQTILKDCVQMTPHISIIVFVGILRPQMLSDVREVTHLEDLIESNNILQFHFIKWGSLILKSWFYFSLNLAAEGI